MAGWRTKPLRDSFSFVWLRALARVCEGSGSLLELFVIQALLLLGLACNLIWWSNKEIKIRAPLIPLFVFLFARFSLF